MWRRVWGSGGEPGLTTTVQTLRLATIEAAGQAEVPFTTGEVHVPFVTSRRFLFTAPLLPFTVLGGAANSMGKP